MDMMMMEQPTLFETAASERVVPALLSALDHAITVIATRHPHRPLLLLHAHREECIALALLVVERQGGVGELLTKSERFQSVVLHVLVAYASRKLERMCAPEIEEEGGIEVEGGDASGEGEGAGGRGFEMPAEPRMWAMVPSSLSSLVGSGQEGGGGGGSWRSGVRKYYPWIHAVKEVAVLGWQIGYLFGKTPHCSPWLWLLGLVLKRVSGTDSQLLDQRKDFAREAQRAFAARQWGPIRLMVMGLLKVWHTLNDRFKVIVLGAGLVIKLADWWFSSQPSNASPTDTMPVPPPPQRPLIADQGVSVPANKDECPLCNNKRTNPTAASSGFVFCYPCIFRYVDKERVCPVSLLPCTPEQLVRIYESS